MKFVVFVVVGAAVMLYYVGVDGRDQGHDQGREKLEKQVDLLTQRDKNQEKTIVELEEKLELVVHSDPKLTLSRVDRCIEAAENGRDDLISGCGSFIGWVEFELESARRAGASKSDIGARIDRMLRMAKARKYYSVDLQTIDKGGSGKLKEYLYQVKQRIN